ncbi:MAG: hypothetical protein U0892_06290 [Pirellulales bacterium]
MGRSSLPSSLKQLPAKWALAVVALLILYGLIQPQLNSRLGWRLPGLASLIAEPNDEPIAQNKSDSKPKESTRTTPSTSPSDNEATPPLASKKSSDKPSTQTPHSDSGPSEQPPKKSDVPGARDAGSDKVHGILTDTGRDRYRSPAGLIYGPGSEEGHRIDHLKRHLKDIPDRPGKHGVFEGELEEVLGKIDEAFERGKKGGRGVSKTKEDDRTVYEVTFDKPIGWIGGRDGKRAGNPAAKKLRLVVEGDRFITAFPF